MSISFQFQKNHQLKNRVALKSFIKEMFRIEGVKLNTLTYIFCSDEFLLDINKRFLKHDYYTDIITFNLSGMEMHDLVGEIYISVDRVLDNAKKLHVQDDYELHRVIFHGVLHLCGYGDHSEEEVLIMRQKEDYYLSSYFNVPRETFAGNC